ncbi:mediator of RNA polymerase II transcription subunit 16 isoform X1 [Colias croceus]|uniref:mediator of RNA polymerase II transcription subunit 16 isoform X1 n=1 Tax=Colias crocea TaxID=72248 RepID=UPI001E27E763|nr:mediator of RNA polymerase II transcription subunit 16 isoform X1 [Colias croceus]
MELVYSMRRKPLKCEPPQFDGTTDPEVVRPICTISTANIIAFTSLTELSDSDGDTWGGHVYVCDLNTPWNSHKVTSTVHPVSALEWDCEGKQLLVATTIGDVSVFGQKDHLLNEWTSLYSASFPGEKIIKAIFFHNGRRIIAHDKKPDALISEKFQMQQQTPTLKGFGGVAGEGACVLTCTGLVGALAAGDERALAASDALRTRDHVPAAAMAHKNGTILVAACSSRGGKRVVRAAVVTARRAAAAAPRRAPVALALAPLPALYLPPDVREPVSISWCLRDDIDSLLIAGSTVSMWKLTVRSYPVHKLLSKGPLQGSTTPGDVSKPPSDCFNSLSWQPTGAWAIDSGEFGTCIASSKLQLNAPLAVMTTPRAIHLLGESHHYLCSRPIVTGSEVSPPASTPPKKTKYGPGVLPSGSRCARAWSADVSWSASAAVVCDSHSQLHVYRIQPDMPAQHQIAHLVTLLEYAMVSGYDYLDVLLTLKPNVLEALYERMTESFQRQPQPFQQFYYHTWLKLRIVLCSMIPTAQSSASNLTSLYMCASAAAACAGALRPDDKPEPAPPAALLALLDDSVDHDKNLVALEAKAEAFGEAAAGALQPLQALRRPLQRALHTALTLLAALAALHNTAHHGYELYSEASAVQLLRKLVVVCRAAGGCSAPELSRPLARLAAHALKPDLLEECLTICAQNTARVWDSLARCGLIAPHSKPIPFYFEYGVEPESLRFTPEPPPYAVSDLSPSFDMDAIRYMYLGGGNMCAKWRACSRCGARALPAAQCARHPLQRAYDGRFAGSCRCGGKWTLISNV